MANSNAWILPLDNNHNIAIGEYEILHLVHFPALFDVPGAPFYCNQVLVWQNQILPAMNLAAWLQGEAQQRDQKLVAITAYADSDSPATQYAGLILADIPRQVMVDDAQACDLPDTPQRGEWRRIAISCFNHNERAIPIIDLTTVFSGALLH